MRKLYVLLFATLLLAACGSNDNGNQTQTNENNHNDNTEETTEEVENNEQEESEANENDEEQVESNHEDNQTAAPNDTSENDQAQNNQAEQEEPMKEEENKNENTAKETNPDLTEAQLTKIKNKLNKKVDGPNGKGYSDFDFFVDDFDYDKGTKTVTVRIALDDGPLPSQDEVKEYTQEIAAYTGSEIVQEDFKTVVSSVLKNKEEKDTYFVIATHVKGSTAYNEAEGLQELQ